MAQHQGRHVALPGLRMRTAEVAAPVTNRQLNLRQGFDRVHRSNQRAQR